MTTTEAEIHAALASPEREPSPPSSRPGPLADLSRLFAPPPGPWSCATCSAEIPTPGICQGCGDRGPRDEHEGRMRLARMTIPERFRWANFEAAELRERVRPATLAVVRSLFGRRLPAGLVLHGPSGAGKSSLACAMLARIHEIPWDAPGPAVERARQAFFVSVPALRSELQEWRRGTPAPDLMRMARAASVLVLDDLDDQPRSEIVDLMSSRHDRERPTIVTTWLSREDASKAYGERLVRRVYEQVISC